MQLISGTTHAETEQPSHPTSFSGLLASRFMMKGKGNEKAKVVQQTLGEYLLEVTGIVINRTVQ